MANIGTFEYDMTRDEKVSYLMKHYSKKELAEAIADYFSPDNETMLKVTSRIKDKLIEMGYEFK